MNLNKDEDMATQSEQSLEQGLIKTLVSMNYQRVDIANEQTLVVNFRNQLNKHNNIELTDDEFNRIMIYLETGSIFTKAEKLRNRFPLTRDDKSVKWIEFLNTQEWCKNDFQVSNQITDNGKRKCRYDVTILVNGLPLVQIELKKRGVELKQAYIQIKKYHKTAFNGLFNYIQIFVISNGVNTRYFANNSNQGYKFTFPWADFKNNHINRLDLFAAMFFEQCTLGKMLAKYVVLHQSDKRLMILRPYQFYAVEALLDKVANSVKNGYIWHTTGSGKTLTSFKAAQLIAEMNDIDKVLFVVDRHDLDTQTKKEYDAFAPGAVDSTDNTKELVEALQGKKKLLITTIQKLNHAVQKDRYSMKLQTIKDKNIVMIFDECHRSQFGNMHSNITGFFNKIRYFGFTGTPILADNANNGRTTKDIFGDRLHEYLIKDAISDENVLGFLVEYHGKWIRKSENDKQVKSIDTGEALLKDDRIATITDFILANYNSSTYERDFNAMFAVGGIKMLIKYYDMFKSRNHDLKIATIFTYTQNEDSEDEFTGLNKGFAPTQNTRDTLEGYIKDYNETFGTDFDTDHFGLYYDDINKRMRDRQIDLLIVSDMFLTGFDAKKLNTLYVDKNLNYHGLLQAFSRTNRVLNEKKKFGKITCFRNIKQHTDKAIELYSNNESSEAVLMKPYEKLIEKFNVMVVEFLSYFPTVKSIDNLESELDKRRFVILFRAMLRLKNEIKCYNEYDVEDIAIKEQQFSDYQSKYLDMSNEFAFTSEKQDAESILQDIDFELELIHRDVINVMYILALLQDLRPESSSYSKDRKAVIDIMDSDPKLRSKIALIDDFIKSHIDGQQSNDFTTDMENDLDKYITMQKAIAIEKVADKELIESRLLHEYVSEYEYLGKPKNEIIKRAIDPLKLPFMEAQIKKRKLIDNMKGIIKLFSWN